MDRPPESALHDAVAAKIEAHPELLDIARENLARWLTRNESRALREWKVLLDCGSVGEVITLRRAESDTAARLRQSSPFAGLLTPEERRAILSRYDPRRA